MQTLDFSFFIKDRQTSTCSSDLRIRKRTNYGKIYKDIFLRQKPKKIKAHERKVGRVGLIRPQKNPRTNLSLSKFPKLKKIV